MLCRFGRRQNCICVLRLSLECVFVVVGCGGVFHVVVIIFCCFRLCCSVVSLVLLNYVLDRSLRLINSHCIGLDHRRAFS